MVAVVAAEAADDALRILAAAGISAWICGEVTAEPGGVVTLTGSYAS
jgi:phosphoribosylformylglycinamidine cyclo-ligase